jgi:hypothetical protein
MVAFDGRDICFSEPWHPHAWPEKYKLSSSFPIVAIGAFGSSIVVGTKGYPYIITGSHPENMSMERTEVLEPCVSKLGMVDVGSGVLYPSNNGIVFVGVGGVRIVTESMFSRDEWQPLNPASMRCDFHNGMVFGWFDENADQQTGFIFNISSGAFSTTTQLLTASYVDPETNKLYVVKNGIIYQWDSHPYNDMSYDWKSKLFYHSRKLNYGYGIVDADHGAIQSINKAINDAITFNTAALLAGLTYGEMDHAMLDEYMLDGSVLQGGGINESATKSLQLTIYADGKEVYTESVTSGDSFSLPAGFKANTWQIRVSGNTPVYSVELAETATELRGS